ncbi:GDSL-type esterase/lipase family protein [Nocardia takedensis]
MRTLAASVAAVLVLLGAAVPSIPAAAAPAATATADAPLLVVLDTSGSMGKQDSAGVNRLDSAKRSMLSVLQELSPQAVAGVWTYPSGSCDAGGFLPGLDMRALDAATRARMSADVLALRADGDTPTAPALRAAARALTDKGFRSATMVLVSDGQSTCGGDPCEAAREIRSEGFELTVHGVGFELSGTGREELECIARTTSGRYISVENGRELIDTLSRITAHGLEVSVDAPGKVIGGGMATVRVRVHNTSLTESARDVRISLAFTRGAHLFPRLAPPVVRLGNLPADATGTYTWQLPVATTDEPGEAALRIVAAAASGANGRHEATMTVVGAGDYDQIATGLLGQVLGGDGTVAIFGDSYAAGEGSGDYHHGTDMVDRRCHRSDLTHVAALFGADRTRNFACSGAIQQHLFAPYRARMPAMSQIEEMSRADIVLDAAFLSIGGNDMGFADIVTRCLFPNQISVPALTPLASGVPWWVSVDIECGHGDADDRGRPMSQELVAQSINERLVSLRRQLPDTYTGLYDAINVENYVQRRGHEAPLFVLGYPKVFPEVVGIGCGEFAPREVTYANRVVQALNDTLAASVRAAAETDGRQIYFIDAVQHAMQPSNTLCDSGNSGVVGVGLLEGIQKKLLDGEHAQELVHPNALGYARIAGAIASWSSTRAAPTDATGTTARDAPYVATARMKCQPLALSMPNPTLGTEPGACLNVRVEVPERSTYWAEVHSSPIALGVGDLDAGTTEIRLDIPDTLAPGRHTLHVVLASETGQLRTYSVELTVAEPLPWWWWLLVFGSAACLLFALGCALRALLLTRGRGRARDVAETRVPSEPSAPTSPPTAETTP